MTARVRPARRFAPAGLGVVALTVLGVLAGGATTTLRGQTTGDVTCTKCHADRAFLAANVDDPDRIPALYLPDSILTDGPHHILACSDCHRQFDAGYPHRTDAVVTPCGTCHAEAGRQWASSIHAGSQPGDAATCVDCHGAHDVLPTTDERSPTFALNVAMTCGSCHADQRIIEEYFAAPADTVARTAVAQYIETVHGVATTRAGLTVAATCNDCHRAHDIRPADSAGSSVSHDNVTETCGACHAGIVRTYAGSAHGVAHGNGELTENGRAAPVCVDCHTAHSIVRADEPAWFVNVVEECGTCHRRLYETYFETYHGQVTRLGFELTAKCSDCHTAHDMRSASDPQSSVYPLNLVATCSQCHPEANDNFAKYYTHGDARDRRRYPVLFWPWLFMTTLLVSVWAFFGVHTVMWFSGLAIERRRARRPGHTDASPHV